MAYLGGHHNNGRELVAGSAQLNQNSARIMCSKNAASVLKKAQAKRAEFE